MKYPVGQIITGYYNLARKRFGILPEPMAHMGASRLAICYGCDELPDGKRCRLCGCDMEAKTLVPQAFCPIGLWGVEPFTVEIKDMKTIKPGYRYIVANNIVSSVGQVIQFIEKKPSEETNVEEILNDGTTTEEVLEMLIDRVKFLKGDILTLIHLQKALATLQSPVDHD